MNEDELEKYLLRFPTRFRNYLEREDQIKSFLKNLQFEYEKIKVYRLVHCYQEIHENDFFNNIDEKEYFNPGTISKEALAKFAISVNESKEELELVFKLPNKKRHLFTIAVGNMDSEYGPADFDEDRTHHNWYLYDGCSEKLVKVFKLENVDKNV